ncbi:DUF3027 domain-containing protein [Lentzea alba]|uniref:DUF3027 domain-containing protein n=1 Tax=Lentzea alba TaxID=2714351 RepID=UPI0039BF459F
MNLMNHVTRAPRALDEIHERWVRRRNRDTGDPAYRDEWYDQQCGGCRNWIPVTGALGSDYGVCAGAKSQFDGTVRFEHDGCDAFEDAEGWVSPEDIA